MDGWIPVSEKLPEDGKWTIFTDGKSISVERYKIDAIDHFFPNGRWFELEDAVAWMPLPKPYKSKEKEEEEEKIEKIPMYPSDSWRCNK